MTRDDIRVGLFLAAGATLVALLLFWPSIAPAVECPKDIKACKVIIVTPEQADSMKMLIQNTNLNGPYSQIKQAVEFYVGIIEKAPDGIAADPEKPAPVPEVKK